LRHAPDQQAKNNCLRGAIRRRRSDVIELALPHEAEIDAIPFVDRLMTGDRQIIALFLE
jgi:hypothetical protein